MMHIDGPVRFAIAGFGHIGKRHAAMIAANPACELAAVCDIAAENTLGLPENVPFYQDWEALLSANPGIHVCCICTPNGLHAEQSLSALSHGKHVVVEKPMALSRADCERIIHKALNVSRQVFCVMQNRYSPAAQWLHGLIKQGLLGDIHLVQVQCYWNRDERYYRPGGASHPWHGHPQLDGGTLYTQFAHFIDILYWIFGDIHRIQSQFYDFAHSHTTAFEDSGTAFFELVQGGMGSLTFSTAVWGQNFESTLTAVGSKGTVKLGGQYMNEVAYCHIEGYDMPELPAAQPANEYGGYQGSAANHHHVIQNVVEVLKGQKETTTNALEGMKVVDMIERIYQAGSRPMAASWPPATANPLKTKSHV